jgi:hypothetical protein
MLPRSVASVFLVLHGLVHMLYFAQSARIFELKPGMTWPVGSWALSRPLGDSGSRTIASVVCALVAIGFLIGAVALISGQPWWRAPVVASGAVSTALFLICWNGRMQNLDGQGAVGILLDGLILVAILILRWP